MLVIIAFFLSLASFSITLFIFAEQKVLRRDLNSKIKQRENHAKEQIYDMILGVHYWRIQRDRILKMPEIAFSVKNTTKKTNVLFMSKRLKHSIDHLSHAFTMYSNDLPPKFIKRSKDAMTGYDFLSIRMDLHPLEPDDPGGILQGDGQGFIEELKKIVN